MLTMKHLVSAGTIDEVIKKLETTSVNLFKWFADNQMKANQDKYHLIVSQNESASVHNGPFEMKNTNCEKLLGIKVDSRLNFSEHLDGIIKKASRKIKCIIQDNTIYEHKQKAHSYELILQLTI